MPADSHIIRFSLGRGKNLAKAKNKALPWKSLVKLFETPTKTGERFKEYLKLPHEEQVALKSTNGWFFRTQIDGERRNRQSGRPSDLITLDFDYATPEFLDDIKAGKILPGHAFFVHSTRRHTDEKPRVRMVIALAQPLDNDTYGAASRIVCAQEVDPDMKFVDLVSFRPAQMMFMPTTSRDGDWFWYEQEGEPLDYQANLDLFEMTVGDWNDFRLLPVTPGEKLRKRADKAEDPTMKKGPIGDFCRAYSVPDAIEKFLPDVYAPVDDGSQKPRYTFLGGTTTNGAVVEDDGLFLYSHHGSDPAGDQLCNAFDLVRIHLFGKEDKDFDTTDQPPGKWPSYGKMVEFIQTDELYRSAALASRYDMASMFDDIDEESSGDEISDEELGEIASLIGTGSAGRDSQEPESPDSDPDDLPAQPKRPAPPKPPKNWMNKLDLTQEGFIKVNLYNLILIMRYDPRFHGRIARNQFTGQVVLVKPIKPKGHVASHLKVEDEINGTRWQDEHDVTIRAVLETPAGEGKSGYGLRVPDRDLVDAISGAANFSAFHPIRDMLDSLVWDGVPRVEKIGPSYFGTTDSAYHRQVFKMTLVASVARIYEPGHKFDFAPILEGAQGIMKSTFIKVLYGAQYFCEIDCDLDDRGRVVELISGKWVGELPELGALHKSDFNSAKQFMRRQTDDVRLAYARRTTEHPRQTIFWGTTNDRKYLKDPTGNRSFWPVAVNVPQIDIDRLRRERLQIWAEAVAMYREMRRRTNGELNLSLGPDAVAEALEKQEGARPQELAEEYADKIRMWADEPITLLQLLSEHGLSTEKFGDPEGLDPETTMVVRTVWRQEDIMEHALGLKPTVVNFVQKQLFEKTYAYLTDWQPAGPSGARRFGIRARWRVRKSASEYDRQRGYSVVDDGSGKDLI